MPKSHSSGHFNLSDRSHRSISQEVFTKTHFLSPHLPTISKYRSLTMSEKEHRMSASKKWPLMFSLHYRIIAHSLYKVWKMPKSMKKEAGVIYDSIIHCNPSYIPSAYVSILFLVHKPPSSFNIISQYIMSLKLF